MDPSTLRWILIVCGVALIGGLLLFGNPNRKPKQRKVKRRKPNRRKAASGKRQEPVLEEGGEPSRFDDPEFSSAPRVEPSLGPDQGELPIGESDAGSESGSADGAEPAAPSGPPLPAPDKVVVLYLQARENRQVVGVELLAAAVKSGMEFGEMNIFHRKVKGDERPVFSMANLENPGHFDPDEWPSFSTPGMTLFMGLPGPMPALDAWDALVANARRISELLHLDMLDGERNVFTRQREGEIREELREFERQQLPEE
jgi:cell division protein ZipA